MPKGLFAWRNSPVCGGVSRGPVEAAAAQHVRVHVEDGLACLRAGVEHDPVARLGDALVDGDLVGLADDLGEQLGVGRGQLPAVGWWSRGMTSTCVGACGLMSRNATVPADSRTIFAGTSPETILQNRQSVICLPRRGR